MSSPEMNEAESKWLGVFSWERWALQSLRVRLSILIVVAVGIQVLVWALWTGKESLAQNDAAAWTTEAVTDAEFELASAVIAQAPQLSDWVGQGAHSPTTISDVWLDMALEAQRLGLTVLEPQQAMMHGDAGLEETVSSWLVKGPFATSMQWVTNLSIQYPHLMMKSFNIASAKEEGQILLKVLWRLPEKEFALSSTPSTSLKSKLEALQHWQKTYQPLLQPDTWPSFDGVDMPLGTSSISAPWPEGWALEWQRDRQHVLANAAIGDLRWRGAMMSRGQAVALVEVGSEVWTVERGDEIGQGRYRVVQIKVDHMVLQQSIPGERGRFELKDMVLGAHTDKATP